MFKLNLIGVYSPAFNTKAAMIRHTNTLVIFIVASAVRIQT